MLCPFCRDSSRRFKMYYMYRETNFGTLTCVPCREVYYIVSLSRRVHYQRFHCNYIRCCIYYWEKLKGGYHKSCTHTLTWSLYIWITPTEIPHGYMYTDYAQCQVINLYQWQCIQNVYVRKKSFPVCIK